MRNWAQQHLPSLTSLIRVLECGSGNGTLLLSFLSSPYGSDPQQFHLTGIDYSHGASLLAAGVEAARRTALTEDNEDEEVLNPVPPVDWREGDLLRDEYAEKWDLVLDKGTFDALCLSDIPVEGEGRLPSLVYPERVSRLVQDGGFFLITSCNFTKEEIIRRWTKDGLGFGYHSSVPHRSFTFGGKQGSTVCTVAFRKLAFNKVMLDEAVPGEAESYGDDHEKDDDPLYICIDCGGTKTDVAIASASSGIVARGTGGTGNIAQAGLHMALQIIRSTVVQAVANLPARYRQKPLKPSAAEASDVNPVRFADVWVGISGCDTPLDQERMSKFLGPFFSRDHVPILNDAHLLGGALLTHHCPWGIAVIAGTGSVVLSLRVNSEGAVVQTGRRGGLGHLLGDDGSAFDIGRCALRIVSDVSDCGEEVEGGLAETIRKHFGVQETTELLAKVYHLDPNLDPFSACTQRKLRIASLSRPVLAALCASPPDPLAVQAVQDASASLVQSIVALAKQNERCMSQCRDSGQIKKAALMLGGSVIRQDCYRKVVIEGLKAKGIEFGIVEVAHDVAGEGVMGLIARARGRGQ